MKTFLKVIGLSMLLALATNAQVSPAQVSGNIHIRIAPPARVREVRGPRPDRKAVWVGGYQKYNEDTHGYSWQAGKWDHAPRHGAVWVAPRYQHHRGEYVYTPGKWR